MGISLVNSNANVDTRPNPITVRRNAGGGVVGVIQWSMVAGAAATVYGRAAPDLPWYPILAITAGTAGAQQISLLTEMCAAVTGATGTGAKSRVELWV